MSTVILSRSRSGGASSSANSSSVVMDFTCFVTSGPYQVGQTYQRSQILTDGVVSSTTWTNSAGQVLGAPPSGVLVPTGSWVNAETFIEFLAEDIHTLVSQPVPTGTSPFVLALSNTTTISIYPSSLYGSPYVRTDNSSWGAYSNEDNAAVLASYISSHIDTGSVTVISVTGTDFELLLSSFTGFISIGGHSVLLGAGSLGPASTTTSPPRVLTIPAYATMVQIAVHNEADFEISSDGGMTWRLFPYNSEGDYPAAAAPHGEIRVRAISSGGTVRCRQLRPVSGGIYLNGNMQLV
jgi:hypothetical protein